MGYNSSVIVMNDSLSAIETDPDFGKNLSEAIAKASLPKDYRTYGDLDVRAHGHVNAATVIESHHADQTSIIAIGGNYGTQLGTIWGYKHHADEDKLRVLTELAKDMGYSLVKA